MKDRRYKIVHLTTVHPPYDTRILRRECVTLAEQNPYEVSLFNGHGINGAYKGVNLVSIDNKERGRLGRIFIRGWLAFIATKESNPDVCHIHDPEIIWIGALLRIYGSKVIYDAHEDYSQKIKCKNWLPRPLRSSSSALYKAISNILVKKLDAVISATDSIGMKHRSKRNCTVHNYPRFRDLGQRHTERAKIPRQIVYTGGLTERRGIEQVLTALCEHCPGDWHLIIVGRSTSETATRLAGYLEDRRVEYRGVVPFEDVKVLLKESEIGVVCNQSGFDYENALPNKLFEYMAAGLTVVCSDFKAWREIVGNTGSGYTCNTSDPKILGCLFNYLFDNRERLKGCGPNGKKAIQNYYSWERESEKLLALYKDLLDEHSPTG